MAPDYPSDLIQDLKIRLRQAAGVASYDPGDPALGSFPYVADAVAALDPTLPDYLRCKRCHGGLLRGINSTLCIFCGAEQRGDDFSRTISFNSTAGYRRFLQSLDLDGSEVVNLEAESKESSRGKDSPKVGVTLSNILDLKLRWPREREEIDNSNSNVAPFQVALVSLSGVNLDNFFSDQKNEVSSRPSTSHSTSNAPQVSGHRANSFSVDLDSSLSVTRNETASNLSSRSQKFGFFERQKSLDVANSSADAKGSNLDDGFADWETDFQSAGPATFEATAKPIDPVRHALDFQNTNMGHNSSNDTGGVLAHEVDHGTGGNLMHEADEAISRNDWFQSSKISKETDQLDSISSSIFVGELKNEERETTSVKVSWTQDDLWQRSVNEINNKSFDHHDDDLFDDWQDFTTATNSSGNLSVLQSVTSDKVHVLPSEANSGDLEDLEFGCFIQSDSFSSALNGRQSPNHVNNRQGGDSIAKRTNQSNVSDPDASQYKVDMLLAQMPDLSFMLEESLSIPRNC